MVDDQLIDEVGAAARSGDLAAFRHAVKPLVRAATDVDPDRAGEVLDRLAGLFPMVPSPVAGRLALGAAVLVVRGAPASGVLDVLADGLFTTVTGATEFAATWHGMFGDRVPLPDPADEGAYDPTVRKLTRGRLVPRRPGLPASDAKAQAGAWFLLGDWARAASGLLERREARRDFSRRGPLADLVTALAAVRSDVSCLADQLAVLDDETLIVVHRCEPYAFRVSISGVGDNFQLCTLLADALNGDPADGLIPGVAPEPDWLAAATTGPADGAERIEARFALTDCHGRRLDLAGRPSDIALLDGWRVVVLDPPASGRSWNLGRTHAAMTPEVRVTAVLDAATADGGRSAVAAPRPPDGPEEDHLHFDRRGCAVDLTV